MALAEFFILNLDQPLGLPSTWEFSDLDILGILGILGYSRVFKATCQPSASLLLCQGIQTWLRADAILVYWPRCSKSAAQLIQQLTVCAGAQPNLKIFVLNMIFKRYGPYHIQRRGNFCCSNDRICHRVNEDKLEGEPQTPWTYKSEITDKNQHQDTRCALSGFSFRYQMTLKRSQA